MAKVIEKLNEAGTVEHVPVSFTKQPAKSPDFNALDLGAWWSLAAGVESVKAIQTGPAKKVPQRIIDHVTERWKHTWDPETRLENIFATKERIMKVVHDNGGSIKYKMPRSGKSHKNDKASFVPRKKDSKLPKQ